MAKNLSLKVIKAVILYVDTYEQDILSVGNNNQKTPVKDKWNHCNNIPMLSLLVDNHRPPLFHMDKSFIWLEETKERINDFSIGYMINPKFNFTKAFREKVFKCMNNTVGPINQTYIRATLAKKTTRVLELLMF